MDEVIVKKLQNYFKINKSKVNFVHVDLFKSFKINYKKKYQFILEHYNLIKKCTNYSNLWFPAFNYSFSETKKFDVQKDKSETGVFTEFYRKYFAKWRTEIPIFSIVGDGKKPFLKLNKNKKINPFNKNSFFHKLYKLNANIFFYGTDISSGSFVMYIEETLKKPILYRYKKLIKGKIINNKKTQNVILNLSVRPPDDLFQIEYDWKKIKEELIKKKILFSIESINKKFSVLNLKKTKKFLEKKIYKDIFYLLNNQSKKKIKNFYLKNKRGFHYNDFEKKN